MKKLVLVILLILFRGTLWADCNKTLSETETKSLLEQAINLKDLLDSLSNVKNVDDVSLTSSSSVISGGQISYNVKLYVNGKLWCNYDIDLSFSIQPACADGMLGFTPTQKVVHSVTGGGFGCPETDEIKNNTLPPVLQPFINQNFAANEPCESLSIESGYLCLDPYSSSMVDYDGDGITEQEGDCDDNDPQTYPGANELLDGLDNDCDGATDEETIATDDDGDGFSEEEGDCNDTNNGVFPEALDDECDGVDNDCSGTSDDGEEADCDQDGVDYQQELKQGTNPLKKDNPIILIITALLLDEDDTDNDTIEDSVDNCPNLANPDQADQDKDGMGNLCDPDDDNDGVLDEADNCPYVKNPDQKDPNGNGIGYACDKMENPTLQFLDLLKKGKLKIQNQFKIDPNKFKKRPYWKSKWFP